MNRVALTLCFAASCGDNVASSPPEAQPPSWRCPAPNEPLELSGVVQTLAHEPCRDYTQNSDATLAVALCRAPPANGTVSEGATGDVLQPNSIAGTEPRLAPEGDELIVKVLTNTSGDDRHPVWRTTWRRHARVGSDWIAGTELPFTVDVTPNRNRYSVSTFTRHDIGRAFVLDRERSIATELSADGTMLGSYTPAAFGVSTFAEAPQMSPDGLRVVIKADNIYFSDRAALDAPFRPASIIEAVPPRADTPFLTADCSRVYFSGYNVTMFEDAR